MNPVRVYLADGRAEQIGLWEIDRATGIAVKRSEWVTEWIFEMPSVNKTLKGQILHHGGPDTAPDSADLLATKWPVKEALDIVLANPSVRAKTKPAAHYTMELNHIRVLPPQWDWVFTVDYGDGEPAPFVTSLQGSIDPVVAAGLLIQWFEL